MAKQKLSPTARRAKAIRDKKAAMTEDRKKKKRENLQNIKNLWIE